MRTLLLAFLLAAPVAAQDINVDFSQTPGEVPPSTFGAAGQTGTWNGIDPQPDIPVPLVDVSGAPTGVTVTVPQFGGGVISFDDPDLPTDVNELLKDGIWAGDLPEFLTVDGLRPGEYDLLMYGFLPNMGGWETWFLGPGGQQITNSLWLGQFQLGFTHVRVRALFSTGSFTVSWANPFGTGFGDTGAFSGIQIERVWKPLGGGTSGVNGVPRLSMSGVLKPGTTVSLALTQAAPSSLAVVFMNVNSVPAPFLGGTLHAFPVTAQVLAFTDAAGALSGSTTFSGAPSGTPFTFQVGVVDGTVPIHGASLSGAVVGTAF